MTPRARKTATPAPEKVEIMPQEPVVDETPKKRGGRKASPLTAVLKEFETAKHKLTVANKRAATVQTVVEAQEAAQARYDAAKQALDEVYGVLTA